MKNKKTAIILSLLFPGLGHLYVRKWVDGVVFIAGFGFLLFVIFSNRRFVNFDSLRGAIVFAAFIGIYLYAMLDIARRDL